MNVFHQIDGWYLAPKSIKTIGQKDLEDALGNIAKAVFGPDVKYRLNPDTFPYTDPSLEMEVEIGGKWVEVVGCGVVKGSVLEKLGVDSKITQAGLLVLDLNGWRLLAWTYLTSDYSGLRISA